MTLKLKKKVYWLIYYADNKLISNLEKEMVVSSSNEYPWNILIKSNEFMRWLKWQQEINWLMKKKKETKLNGRICHWFLSPYSRLSQLNKALRLNKQKGFIAALSFPLFLFKEKFNLLENTICYQNHSYFFSSVFS